MKRDLRMNLTMALFIVLAGACTAGQKHAVHDALAGFHAICEGTDPVLTVYLADDGGARDTASGKD